jgi:serine/threonine protein kinase
MAFSVPDLCGLLIRSRLISVEGVKALYQRWESSGKDVGNPAAFCAWLVARGYLTSYQANLLASGRVDHFFLSHYKILERIGKGRTAGVYKAVGPKSQLVAVKVLPPSKAKEKELWARFQRETRLAMQLNHPSVVRTIDFGRHNNICYYVMEFLDGNTLDKLLAERGRLPAKEAVRVGFLAALGLQHVFEQGLVHRDLAPSNLMLCPAPGPKDNTLRSMVKILDIGLGRVTFDPDSPAPTENLTNEGSILGSPDYLAPEQARDPRRVDIRADIYSLGCTLYHALAGEPPFKDNNLIRQILRHATQQPRPLREFNPEVPDEVEAIVLTMLAKDPAQRYPTPAKAADALKGFLALESPAPRKA